MSTSVLKLPFTFSEDRLLQDLSICEKESYVPHFNTNDYEGTWTSIALRSRDGEIETIFANSIEGEFQDTPLLKQCDYFREVVDSFLCEKESVRLLRLAPGSVIKEHTDYCLSYDEGFFRLHVPIQTNSKLEFYIDSERVTMTPGECWYGDFGKTHSVINNGTTARVHLVMDCVRNEWSDILFEKAGYESAKLSQKENPETQLKIIEALELLDTEFSRSEAHKLRSALSAQKK